MPLTETIFVVQSEICSRGFKNLKNLQFFPQLYEGLADKFCSEKKGALKMAYTNKVRHEFNRNPELRELTLLSETGPP